LKKVYIIGGPIKGESFTLNDDVTTIGRSSDNDICISDIGASRHHAKFVKKGDRIFITDLKSSQGVFVDRDKIEPGLEVELNKDTTLMIGNTILSFQKASFAKTLAKPYSFAAQTKPFDISKPSEDGSRNYIQSLELLLKVSNIFAQSLNIQELLGLVIDQILTLLKRINRGAILLLNKDTGKLQEVVSKTRIDDKDNLFSKINYSRSIVNRTIKEAKPVKISNTSLLNKTNLSDSMEQMNVMSVMCVPLIYKKDILGVIYVDSIDLPEGFRKDDLELLTGLSNTASIAIENARLYSNLETLVKQRTSQLEKAKDKFKESESRFRAVFENMSNGVCILEEIENGKDFILKDFNKATERIDKITKQDAIGRSVLTVFPRFKDHGFFDIFKRVWEKGKPEDHPPMLYEDDRIKSWRTNYVYKLPNGEIVCIYEDVTAQKQAIENQQKLQRQLSHAQKLESLGRLAGGVAHNFRNILQAVMGNSQFLQMAYSQDDLLQKITGTINESVKKGSHFIDSLLKFSRQDIEKEMVPLNLSDVLKETYKIISNTFDHRIKIVTKIEESLPMRGDHLSLNQVFINLCNNALDAMPGGGDLTIETKKDTEKVMVTISDTGCGMDEETLKNIFDPFYTTKDIGEGTGLGLSITHGIIEEHTGTVSVSSQPNKGTTFTISFPIAEKFFQAESESPLRIRRGKGEKVLIVDDEPDVLKGLENMVKSIGYEVDSARNGNKALEHYKTYKPDVVLLDWKMPIMDGVTCAKKILENDPAARIVIISGYQESAVDGIDTGLKTDIKDFVLKPFDLNEISKVISKALQS
jgi:signal transduction histidine kinase/CheY-like chemotaxis protein